MLYFSLTSSYKYYTDRVSFREKIYGESERNKLRWSQPRLTGFPGDFTIFILFFIFNFALFADA